MPRFAHLRGAWECAECRRYRRLALAFTLAALCWMVLL